MRAALLVDKSEGCARWLHASRKAGWAHIAKSEPEIREDAKPLARFHRTSRADLRAFGRTGLARRTGRGVAALSRLSRRWPCGRETI